MPRNIRKEVCHFELQEANAFRTPEKPRTRPQNYLPEKKLTKKYDIEEIPPLKINLFNFTE